MTSQQCRDLSKFADKRRVRVSDRTASSCWGWWGWRAVERRACPVALCSSVSSMTVLTAFGGAPFLRLSLSVSLQSCNQAFLRRAGVGSLQLIQLSVAPRPCAVSRSARFLQPIRRWLLPRRSALQHQQVLSTAFWTILSASLTACSARAAFWFVSEASFSAFCTLPAISSASCCISPASVSVSLAGLFSSGGVFSCFFCALLRLLRQLFEFLQGFRAQVNIGCAQKVIQRTVPLNLHKRG